MFKTIYPLKTIAAIACMVPFSVFAQHPAEREWVKTSDKYTQMLIDLDKKYSPEYGSSQGLAAYDTLISAHTLAADLAERKEEETLVKTYTAALKTEKDAHVQQDLKILISHLNRGFRQQDFGLNRKVPYYNPTTIVYGGLEVLLDEQTAAERRFAAVVRLRKYAGLVKGYKPLTAILKERTLAQMAKPKVIYPSKQKMEADLSRNQSVVDGIAELCESYKLTGWQEPYNELRKQLLAYDEWVKATLLPKARTDFRLPPEEYALELEDYGIDIPPAEVARMAHAAFTDIQQQMQPIAAEIAKARNLPSADYRDVMRALKKEQILGDSIMPLYKRTLTSIEKIIRDHELVTLPDRPAIIRLATEAETAQRPAPYMQPPPFLNNTGQRGVFVLPLNMPAKPGEKADKYDDFTFEAAAWTLTAHEARPGHELQFDKMVEEGVSTARSLYAFNSTNAEGWGLYAEYITKPYMPLEGQLVSLDYRLLRAARAFLDPELQAGKITQEQAMKVLMNDVVQSRAFAQQEVERYTNRAPGQANSYFYGFTKMIQLRADTEKALGSKFSALRFHNFILSQGLLSPALIREAVMNEFIPAEKGK